MMRSLILTAGDDGCRDTLLTKVREVIGVPAELAPIAATFFPAESRTGAHVR
jgi:hypothetical protein